jgi:hypothetical protein
MKSSVFWDVTPFSPGEYKLRFIINISPPFSVSKIKPNRPHTLLADLAMLDACLVYFSTLKSSLYVPPKRRVSFTGLPGLLSQKIVLSSVTVLCSRVVMSVCVVVQ